MIIAKSTRSSVIFPDLGLSLPAGEAVQVPNPDPSVIARLKAIPGVVVEDVETTTSSTTTEI